MKLTRRGEAARDIFWSVVLVAGCTVAFIWEGSL